MDAKAAERGRKTAPFSIVRGFDFPCIASGRLAPGAKYGVIAHPARSRVDYPDVRASGLPKAPGAVSCVPVSCSGPGPEVRLSYGFTP